MEEHRTDNRPPVSSPENTLPWVEKAIEGIRQLDAGEGIEHDRVKERLARWLG